LGGASWWVSIVVLSLLCWGKVVLGGVVIVGESAIWCGGRDLGCRLIVGAAGSGVHREVCKVGGLGADVGGACLGRIWFAAWLLAGVKWVGCGRWEGCQG